MDQENLREREHVLLLERGKRGLLRIVFGRTGVIILLLVLQVFLLLLGFRYLERYVPYFLVIATIFSVIIVLHLLSRDEDPTVKLTWVILVMATPVFGTLLFLYIQTDLGHRFLHKRLETVLKETEGYFENDAILCEKLQKEDREFYNLAVYLKRHGGYPIYENTDVRYFPLGDDKFKELLKQLEQAEQFIFLEYFIIAEGYMWGRVLDILERKVREGVEVRVLYDGTCAVNLLPYAYPKKLQALGIQCKMFAPLRPLVSTHYNNRDHRKILVIDGRVAFTGGVNLADEYINLRVVHGHWKDTAVMLTGAAVASFTLMFLQMWNINEKQEDYEKYLRCSVPVPASGYVLPYGDSPLDDERVGEMVYLDILNQAQRYVHIMSPYLILDYELVTALTFAAKRGVEVALILPHIPDKKFAYALAHSHYRELLAGGVQIYEYTPGFVHAKVFVSDDRKAVVGTINLDYRSLYHHFECAAYLRDVSAIHEIEADVQGTLAQCQRITLQDVRRDSVFLKLAGKLLKFLAPLM
jgi:cardiolipin synthase